MFCEYSLKFVPLNLLAKVLNIIQFNIHYIKKYSLYIFHKDIKFDCLLRKNRLFLNLKLVV